jgi:hypothetical protein
MLKATQTTVVLNRIAINIYKAGMAYIKGEETKILDESRERRIPANVALAAVHPPQC